MAMIPTLKMFTTTVTKDPHYMDPICAEVQQFHQLGGTLLFGTDVGYMIGLLHREANSSSSARAGSTGKTCSRC